MKLSEQAQQHLFNRLFLGIKLEDNSFQNMEDSQAIIEKMFNTYSPYQAFEIINPEISMDLIGGKKMTAELRKKARRQSSKAFRDLNIAWLNEMMLQKNPLNERMAFFWHGHFACRSANSYHMQQYLNIIRENALGSFKTMLMAISKTPAMLSFLNNQQNKVAHPNENFAREVMELFTMGIGHYTENDVKEGARAFTGWAFNRNSDTFEFKEKWHDKGEKTFLGHTGNFKGEDIIALLLKEKQTARNVTQKIWRFFVNEKVNEKAVEKLADIFYESDYNISVLVIALFSSKEFYYADNRSTLVKSPIELIVNLSRQLDLKWMNTNALIRTQRVLGQVLMLPPNVSGWKGGKAWIDTSSLTLRMSLPNLLLMKNELKYQPKDEVEVFEMNNETAEKKNAIVKINWLAIENKYKAAYKQKNLELFFLPIKSRQNDYYKNTLKDTIVSIMGLPEYQLI
jgi:uncharacterized protein (DUF1800 family)